MLPPRESPVLGPLTAEAGNDIYRWVYAAAPPHGGGVAVRVDCNAEADGETPHSEEVVDRLVALAEGVWRDRERHFDAFRDHAASELLDDLNNSLHVGRDEPPEEFTAGELRAALEKPDVIGVESYEDEDDGFFISGSEDPRFGDSYITVRFSADGTVEEGEVEVLH